MLNKNTKKIAGISLFIALMIAVALISQVQARRGSFIRRITISSTPRTNSDSHSTSEVHITTETTTSPSPSPSPSPEPTQKPSITEDSPNKTTVRGKDFTATIETSGISKPEVNVHNDGVDINTSSNTSTSSNSSNRDSSVNFNSDDQGFRVNVHSTSKQNSTSRTQQSIRVHSSSSSGNSTSNISIDN